MTTRSYRTTPGALHADARTDADPDRALVAEVLARQGVDERRSYSTTNAAPISERSPLYRAEFARTAHAATPAERAALAAVVARIQATPSPTAATVKPTTDTARTERGARARLLADAGTAWRDTAPDDDEPGVIAPLPGATGYDAGREALARDQGCAWKLNGGCK